MYVYFLYSWQLAFIMGLFSQPYDQDDTPEQSQSIIIMYVYI